MSAVFDACVLYPAPLRDFLLRLTKAGVVDGFWSSAILDECFRSVARNRPDLPAGVLEASRAAMETYFPSRLISGHEPLIEDLSLPDPNDRHVLAAIGRDADAVLDVVEEQRASSRRPPATMEQLLDRLAEQGLRRSVVAALLELHRSGIILTKRNVPPPLYNKATRLFGTWRGALGTAGLDYDAATKAAFAARADARTSVTAEVVVGQLQSRLAAGYEMNYSAVRRDDGALAQRCARAFGSHDVALLAAGLSPEEIRRQELWHPDRILSEVRDCLDAGWDMNSCAAQRRASRLFGAACREFGSWDEALLGARSLPAGPLQSGYPRSITPAQGRPCASPASP